MIARSAIYYPYLTIQRDEWLKAIALFYDKLYRITPKAGFYSDYISPIQSELQQSLGFIQDIEFTADQGGENIEWKNVASECCQILSLMIKHALNHNDSPFYFLLKSRSQEFSPYFAWPGYEYTKIPGYWLGKLKSLGALHQDDSGYRFDKYSGMTYMALLANYISQHYGLEVVTDDLEHAKMFELVQYTSPLQIDLIIDRMRTDPLPSEIVDVEDGKPVYLGDIMKIPKPDIPYVLCQVAFKTAGITNIENVPISKIIEFRKKYNAERHQYFNAIISLAKELENISTKEALQNRIQQASNDIEIALKDLRAAMRGLKIDSVLNFASISLSFPLAEAFAKVIPVSHPLLLGSALSLGIAIALRKGQKARKELVKSTPWIYLYQLEKKLNPKKLFQC